MSVKVVVRIVCRVCGKVEYDEHAIAVHTVESGPEWYDDRCDECLRQGKE